jgi:hypothetical protein
VKALPRYLPVSVALAVDLMEKSRQKAARLSHSPTATTATETKTNTKENQKRSHADVA